MQNSELISIAKRVLAKEAKAIAELVGRPPSYIKGISFEINKDGDGIAHCSGKTITLFKKYCDKYPWDVQGVVVHELTHAIQRGAAYEDEFVWMVEGLADFVRYKLGYGKIQPGDPSQSYQVAGGFFNWLYEKPDNKKTYQAFVKDITEGIRPAKLDALLKEYNCGELKKDFTAAANDDTVDPPKRKRPQPPGL